MEKIFYQILTPPSYGAIGAAHKSAALGWGRGERDITGRGLRVDAEAIVFPDSPVEPSFTPETARWLEYLQRLADAGQVDELGKHGMVYVRKSA